MTVAARRVVTVVVTVTTLLAATAWQASAQPRFQRATVGAGGRVQLELLVPETTEEQHTTVGVSVRIPEQFTYVGCVPPDGWDCVHRGQVLRFHVADPPHTPTDSAVYVILLRAPASGGVFSFRTAQRYDDGHETHHTAAGGTAPEVELTDAGATRPASPTAPSPVAAEVGAPSPGASVPPAATDTTATTTRTASGPTSPSRGPDGAPRGLRTVATLLVAAAAAATVATAVTTPGHAGRAHHRR